MLTQDINRQAIMRYSRQISRETFRDCLPDPVDPVGRDSARETLLNTRQHP